MTKSPGKAPPQVPCSPSKSTPRTHQKRHLHLSNNIHVKNHIHCMQRSRMLDPRRTPQPLPLRRELTAVKKVKSLQDPSTSSSFSPVSACSSIARANGGDDQVPGHDKARRHARRRIAREEEAQAQAGVDHSHGVTENLRSHGEVRIGGGGGSRGRRRDADEYAALTEWSDRNRTHQLFSKSHQQALPWSAERWQGDAEEIARRLIAEQNGQMPSPAHSYISNLARAHGLSLLGFRDDITTSEAEGSFLESEDGEAGLPPGVSSSHLSNSAGSPLVRSHRNRRRPLPKDSNGRVGLHNRPPRRAVHGYKEAPVVPTMTDELDVSEMPQNGCGMPWYWTTGANKYKGKSLLDFGLTCAFPETAIKKKAGDSKQVSRASSRHGSQRDLQVPIDHAVPLLNDEETYEDTPARETAVENPSPKHVSKASAFTRSISEKYRPKAFRDMVGQTLVVKSLTTALVKGKVAPVYLFAGPHGTGKTTCARVFAAALVCLNTEPHRRPCGLCRECATITLNRSRDVKEVDVASCSDLDHIKALLSLSPSSHHPRQQVFIVEGCDFLSVELWTSFLKFLDDPPRNVVFILITSDGLERLPTSATSRCQKYHFGKLKESEIVTRLQALAEKENLDVDEAALLLISSRADGSLRDAESMLDQLTLLDQTITLSMVQELSGLIPDEKLVNLLDMALAADTVNTVKGMRALLDAGIDALSLVAQLASLIANILAGTFDLRRESRKKGFFSRNMPRREEQQRLRQALKVLAECEKQLRASNDRPTWLTAALLQFAPDRSYLPSSVDTSMAPSPIAFDTFEKVPTGEPCTPRLPPPQPAGEPKSARKTHSQNSPSDISSGFPRPSRGHRDKDKTPVTAGHPSATTEPALPDQEDHDRGHRPTGSLVLFDPSRAVGNRDFRVLPRRDMEDIWDKVLDGCRSNVLRQLLSSQGTLMALAVARDETFAVAHVEFRSPEHKARAERLRSSTCHAFQMALGCPVELKLSLECPPSVVLEEIKASHVVTQPEPSTCETANDHGNAEDIDPSAESPPHDDEAAAPPRQRRRKPKSRQEMLTGLAARSRRLGDARSLDSRDSMRDQNNNKYCFPMECVPREATGSSRWHRLGRRPSLNNRVPSGRRETLDVSGVKRVSVKWRHPKVKSITNLERRKTRKLEPRRTRTRAVLCWQSPISERGQQEQLQPQRQPDQQSRKATFFLRLVPCGRSTQTHGSPS